MGFFVLLGFAVYVVLAKFAVNAIETYSGSKIAKYVAIAVFVLIPTWDIVPGQLYFQYLCKEESGIKVLKQVETERSYFKPNGQPDEEKLANHFKSSIKVDKYYSLIFHITRFESSLQDKKTGEVLGVSVQLSHHGGWLNAYLFPVGSGTWCAGYSPYQDVWTEVIKPKS